MARVLIVADSKAETALIEEIFREHPRVEIVGKACRVEEAAGIASERKPDLVVVASGVVLREDAVGLAARVYRANPSAVVVVTAEWLPEPSRTALLEVCAIPVATNILDLPHELEMLIPDLREPVFAK